MDYTILDKLTVSDIIEPIRCIDYLIGKFDACSTRNALKKAMKRGEVLVNRKPVNTGDWLQDGDTVELLETRGHKPKPLEIDIPIIYEDDHLIIVNKPAGLLTSGNHYDTLVNAMVGKGDLSKLPDAWDWFRPIHRLDRVTSGLVIFSKSASVHMKMVELFETREIEKVYVAIVKGEINGQGMIDQPIDGKIAKSEYRSLSKVNSVRNGVLSMIELRPKTGRTHQLRIHCAGIGHPIIGDKIYDEPGNTLSHKGLFLAAIGLHFRHPISGKEMHVEIDIPKKFSALMDREARWFDRIHNS